MRTSIWLIMMAILSISDSIGAIVGKATIGELPKELVMLLALSLILCIAEDIRSIIRGEK